jgi:hypothetical protein
MFKQQRAAAPTAVRFIVHVLVFAVFVWVLQAKLSLYKTHYCPSVATVAKGSIEKRSAQTLVSPERTTNLGRAWENALLATLVVRPEGISGLSLRSRDVALSLFRPCRMDSTGTYLMRRPPPGALMSRSSAI